jgi:tight adherence protein B
LRRVALAALILAAAVPATAAAGVRIRAVDATTAFPRIRVTVVTGTSSARPTLRENGLRVLDLEVQNLGRRNALVLAIDRSRSMVGRPLREAAAAARAFVAAKPTGTRVEIVALGRRAVELTGMSTATIDGDRALRAIAVERKEGTALWAAVSVAARALDEQQSGRRALILLTDGNNTKQDVSLEEAIADAREFGVSVYPIGIESKQFSPTPLQRLARETGGTYYAAKSSGALTAIYKQISRELERTWRLSYPTSARPGETVKLTVQTARSDGATRTVKMPGLAEAAPKSLLPVPLLRGSWGALLVALLAGILVRLAWKTALRRPPGEALARRVEAHVGNPDASGRRTGRRADVGATFARIVEQTERLLESRRAGRSLGVLLERAGMTLKPAEVLYIGLGVGVLLALLTAATLGGPLPILAALLLGVPSPALVVARKARRRVRAFDEQLPDLLAGIAASLKAGHGLKQAIQALADESEPPASVEFKRIVTETRFGRPLDEALDALCTRINSEDLEYAATAISVQSQAGGSLAGLFDMVADTVRTRQQHARKVRALTAMGRMSAYVLIALPFALAGIISLLNPGYLSPLFTTTVGNLLVGVGLVLMASGSVVLKRIVTVKE